MIQSITRLLSAKPSSQSGTSEIKLIANACAQLLRELGLHVGGNVFSLRSSQQKEGWLVQLLVPEAMQLRPEDSLALQMLLQHRIARVLGPQATPPLVLLSLNSQAKKLPIPVSELTVQWMRERVANYSGNALALAEAARSNLAARRAERASRPVPLESANVTRSVSLAVDNTPSGAQPTRVPRSQSPNPRINLAGVPTLTLRAEQPQRPGDRARQQFSAPTPPNTTLQDSLIGQMADDAALFTQPESEATDFSPLLEESSARRSTPAQR